MHMTLKDALERLYLTDVWDMAPNPNNVPMPKRGNVVVKSPFRLDHKGQSFSVDKDLKLFKDFVEGIGGSVWKFVELCEPNWSKSEIARELIRRAGGDPDAKDPNYKPVSQAERQLKAKEQGEKAYREHVRKQTYLETIPEAKLQKWSSHFVHRWQNFLEKQCTDDRIEQLADERGWPVEWVQDLIDIEKMVFNRRGQPVFKVEVPDASAGLFAIGYHHRWLDDSGVKHWAYRPCSKWDKREIVAAPFVVGSLESKLWILTEGQWDAVTIWGLLGGFEDVMLCDAVIFGIRGVSGRSVFMELYKRHLRKCHLQVVLIPDCDMAARGWTEAIGKDWSFMRQLQGVFPRLEGRIAALKLKRRGDAKDINDFYKKCNLTSVGFLKMLEKVMEGFNGHG